MKKKLFSLLIFIVLVIIGSNIYTLDKSDYDQLKCVLNVYKSSYEIGEEIIINFKVRNEGYNPINLKLSEKSYFNFGFSVKSINNRMINETRRFYLEKSDSVKENKKYTSLKLGHKQFYGQSFNLSKYFQIDKPGHYVIEGHFYPIPYNLFAVTPLSSQIIQIEIRKSEYKEQLRIENEINLDRQLDKVRNPYDTVEFMLKGKIKKNWKQYFKYIDLNKLINQFPNYNNRYQAQRPSQRRGVIYDFKNYLKNYLFEIGLQEIKQFKIYRSVIENERKKAVIHVRISFKSEGITVHRNYEFYLYQKNKRWYVYSWKVMNI